MSTETTNLAPGSPQPPTGGDQANAEVGSPQTEDREIPEGEAEDPPGGEDPPAPVTDDTDEIEHEGQKYRVPKAVKPLLMLHSDYTRKTQELAEKARGLDSERETFTKSTQTERAILAEGRELILLDGYIAQLEAADFPAIQQADPNQANQLIWKLSQLKGQRETKARELQQKIVERQSEQERQAQTAAANRRDQAQAVLARDVEGWSPELQSKIAAFTMEFGFTRQELAQVEDPRLVKLLHSAMIGQEAIRKLKTAGAKPPPTPPTPTVKVGSTSPATKSPERMSTEEWMKHRNAQLRKQRA